MSVTAKRWWGKARRWTGRLARSRATPRIAVLMYHRVAEPVNDPWKMCVGPRRFSEHMTVLAQHCEVIGLSSVVSRLEQPRTRPLVVITFDDGYRDNLEVALPILEKFELPATLFLATDAVDAAEPWWWDVLADLVLETSLPPALDMLVGEERLVWRLQEGPDELRGRLWELLSRLDVSAITGVIRHLCQWAGHEPRHDPLRLPLSGEEIRQLTKGGLVSLGCHSASHLRMTVRDASTCKEELSRSINECRRLVGERPSAFAFPFGEYDQLSVELVKAAGFGMAFTSDEGLVTASSDLFALPRLGVGNWTGSYFDAWLRHYWCA